jgi:predicted DNA-binding protein (MmcQ/YjbR family)
MTLESLREYCLSLPHTTEGIQWDNDLLFRIGGKMFAVACLDVEVPHRVSFKCTPDRFAELVEQQDIIPAPYMARNHWVTLETFEALDDREIEDAVRQSYDLVEAKLTAKLRRALEAGVTPPLRSHTGSRKK